MYLIQCGNPYELICYNEFGDMNCDLKHAENEQSEP